jgi:hypothetical protein
MVRAVWHSSSSRVCSQLTEGPIDSSWRYSRYPGIEPFIERPVTVKDVRKSVAHIFPYIVGFPYTVVFSCTRIPDTSSCAATPTQRQANGVSCRGNPRDVPSLIGYYNPTDSLSASTAQDTKV